MFPPGESLNVFRRTTSVAPAAQVYVNLHLGLFSLRAIAISLARKRKKAAGVGLLRPRRERPENSKAGERRLDVKRGKLPSRDILLEGKSRDFLLLYFFSAIPRVRV